MNTHTSFGKCAGFVLAVSTAAAAFAQGILIGPSIRNGGFEDGVVSPWNTAASVLQDPVFASEGSWYASLQSAFVRPVWAVQNLHPDPADGLVFMLSFDARVGIPGLDVVAPSMDARTPEGASLRASVTPIMVPPLSDATWQNYLYQLEMPASWNISGITFGISFSKNHPLGGVPHTAYLDNVVLQQIPEPGMLALGLCGGTLWLAARGWRRTGCAPKRPVPKAE